MLKVFNTLSKEKESFKPFKGKEVKMYVCGPTVYGYAHIGHGRTYTVYDFICRYLTYRGYKVKYVQNITDVGHLLEGEEVEDKVIKKALEEGKTPGQIATFFMAQHVIDMKALHNLLPHYFRATDFIEQIIAVVEKLVKKKAAYVEGGSVYFDVSKFKDYGRLSGQKVGETIPAKGCPRRSPEDFALWIAAPPNHLMQWDSPWGRGFPGWHIEDTVIIFETLGKQIDIHGGGIDLTFPHHEAEIAQGETLSGKKPYSEYWLHTGMVTIEGAKMSRSKGNIINVREVLASWPAQAVRLWILGTHYRKPLDYTEKDLDRANDLWHEIKNVLYRALCRKKKGRVLKSFINEFSKSFDDDFNTPTCLAVLRRLVNSDQKWADIRATLIELDKILGLGVEKVKLVVSPSVEKLLKQREQSRLLKDFARADRLRQEILHQGFMVEDTKEGPLVYPSS